MNIYFFILKAYENLKSLIILISYRFTINSQSLLKRLFPFGIDLFFNITLLTYSYQITFVSNFHFINISRSYYWHIHSISFIFYNLHILPHIFKCHQILCKISKVYSICSKVQKLCVIYFDVHLCRMCLYVC